ncbi:uncharacterized protein FOMMEDRAFT_23582 [Fomitiporia mediterranea MF3/22]|uniref:uncharacterized protein n=1 Tax=Fomitiporia mediterranea (strain MF3/22) TaxID=694068 RepID=UPI0004407D97|nr:uncharacterized protein FOMMEDRAFT_23582 [Fomitiporia mediterranea MF3/22]EJC98791.1 hypothetical protein FOMMEDRAFT_23582 [Fomitiporia mediterranea MF3/22]
MLCHRADYTVLQRKAHKQQSTGMLATMSRYDYGTLSLTLAVHDTVSNIGSSGQPLTPLLSLSIPSTSLSLFEPEPPRDTPFQLSIITQPTVLLIVRRSQSMQRARTNTALPAAEISLFNAPDLNPGALLTLASHCRSVSITSIHLSTHANANTHAYTFSQSISQPVSQAQQQPLQLVQSYNPHTRVIQLVGTEQRLKRSDEDYIKRSENASILFRHECCLKKNKAEAARHTLESDSPSAYSSLYGCPSDIRTQRAVVCAKWKWQTLLILRWVMQSDRKDRVNCRRGHNR